MDAYLPLNVTCRHTYPSVHLHPCRCTPFTDVPSSFQCNTVEGPCPKSCVDSVSSSREPRFSVLCLSVNYFFPKCPLPDPNCRAPPSSAAKVSGRTEASNSPGYDLLSWSLP